MFIAPAEIIEDSDTLKLIQQAKVTKRQKNIG